VLSILRSKLLWLQAEIPYARADQVREFPGQIEGAPIKTKLQKNVSQYDRSSAPTESHRNSIKRVLVWILNAVLITGLVVFTVLLVWAFTSRSMPALKIWHTASLSEEFTAKDSMF